LEDGGALRPYLAEFKCEKPECSAASNRRALFRTMGGERYVEATRKCYSSKADGE